MVRAVGSGPGNEEWWCRESGTVVARSCSWVEPLRPRHPPRWAFVGAIGYALKNRDALTAFLGGPALPLDNNRSESALRWVALGRKNSLFAGSLRAGQRAAAVMSLIQSARLNDHDPHAYLKDVMTRLPTHKASRIGELLPHRWHGVGI